VISFFGALHFYSLVRVLWRVSGQGSGKTLHYLSKVNDRTIASIIPGMAKTPKLGEIQNIKYEYVTLFDAPLYGHDNMFISIDDKKFTEKHKIYMQQLKPFGLLSIILSIAFLPILVICILMEFKELTFSYVCLGLFVIFLRTVIRWRYNYKLKKKLERESS